MQKQQIEVLTTEIQKLSLDKNDILVLKIKDLGEYTKEKVEQIQKTMKDIVPNNSVIIMDTTESVEVIRKKNKI
jgi:hypothetical protein